MNTQEWMPCERHPDGEAVDGTFVDEIGELKALPLRLGNTEVTGGSGESIDSQGSGKTSASCAADRTAAGRFGEVVIPGSIGDDRFAMVDAETAHSLCTGLHRYLCQHNCGRILLATCKKSVLPFLQPDFVIELLPDKAVVHRNPRGISALMNPMRPMVSIDTAVERFAGGPGGGWRGPDESLDDLPLQSRSGRRVPQASVREARPLSDIIAAVQDWLRPNWVFEVDSGELLHCQDFIVGTLVRFAGPSWGSWGGSGGLG
eukprot:Skav225020  [mRNA]  locus=scaffold6844:24105:33853:- [translate_table: standard]